MSCDSESNNHTNNYNSLFDQLMNDKNSTKIFAKVLFVLFSGTIEPSELRQYLNGPAIDVEIHDRDRKREECKPKPALFGDDLEDEKISNVGTVASKSLFHIVYEAKLPFASDLQQVCGFLWVHWFPPPIKLTPTI